MHEKVGDWRCRCEGALAMNKSDNPYDQLASILQELHGRFGDQLFDDRRRLVSLLADKMPDARREIRLLGSIVEEGVPQKLLKGDRHLVGMEMDRAVDQLEADIGMQRDIARGNVRAIAHALSLGPPPSVYEDSISQPEIVSDEVWSGLSEPVQSGNAVPARPVEQRQSIADGSRSRSSKKKRKALAEQSLGSSIKKYSIGALGCLAFLVGVAQCVPDEDDEQVSQGQISQGQISQGTGFADELKDYGVAEQSELQSNVGSPTPLTIPGATRIETSQLQKNFEDGMNFILVDVLASPHEMTLKGAAYVPFGGAPGHFQDQIQNRFATVLDQLTGNDKSRPIVFFCASASCWESYNAALRARYAGFTAVGWYRGGLAAWSEAQLAMERTPSALGSNANINGGTLSETSPQPSQPSQPMPATPPPGAEAFLRRLYANYETNGDGVEEAASILTRETYRKFMAGGGEEMLDSDPVCQCLDWHNIKVLSINLTSKDSHKSNAVVRFHDVDGAARTVRYQLRYSGSRWLIDDLSLLGGRTLLDSLK